MSAAMKCLIVLGAVAACAQAQVGPSGIVSPDGKNVQFTHDQANSIVLAGPSGIVTKDGRNIQLTAGQAALHAPAPAAPAAPAPATYWAAPAGFGPSGIVKPDGKNVQFTAEQADNFVLVGPSGAVTKDGKNIQFRKKRSTFGIIHGAQVGASGALDPSGTPHLWGHGVKVAAAGPSGIVLTNGQNIQYSRKKRSTFGHLFGAQVGAGGVLDPAGVPHLFAVGAEVAAAGPSGIVLTNGQNVQYSRKKRSTFGHLFGAQVGAGGVLDPAGVPHLFALGAEVAAAGPSGIVLTNGQNIQYSRKKRSTFGHLFGAQVGAGGVLDPAGVPHLFALGAEVAAAGPSGIVLSDGRNIQYSG